MHLASCARGGVSARDSVTDPAKFAYVRSRASIIIQVSAKKAQHGLRCGALFGGWAVTTLPFVFPWAVQSASDDYRTVSDSRQRTVMSKRTTIGADPHEHVDPFTHRPKISTLGWTKVILNTLWLAPLRVLLVVIPSIIMGLIVCSLAIVGDLADTDNPRPLRGWRRFLGNTVASCLSRFFLFGMGFNWITVRGRPAATRDAPLWVVSPHSSLLDMFIIAAFQMPTYVAKREVQSMPVLGYIITHTLRTIFVSRDDPSSRKQCTTEIIRRARDTEAGWPPVMIFPEATTHSREVLLQFKKGAFLPGLPVQAVAIKYGRLTAWGDRGQTVLKSLYLTICQFHNSLELEFLPVHHPTPAEVESPELYAESVRGELSQVLAIPSSTYSLSDMLVCRRAEKLGLPYPIGLVSCNTLHSELRLSQSEVYRWLERFSGMDRDRDGYITADDVCHYLGVPSDACSQAVFAALSQRSEDKLSFRRYLYGIVSQSLPFTTDEALRKMFQFFDTAGKGQVTCDDISSRLPVQWTGHSEPANHRGSPPPQRCGCGVCGCRGSWKHQRCDHTPQLASLPPTMNYDQFCSAMSENLEYVLLYHECQGAVLSSPPPSQAPPNEAPPSKANSTAEAAAVITFES